MVLAYSTADAVVASPIAFSLEKQGLSRTQQTMLLLVNAVPDLRDEDDLQCLAFLAGELAVLRRTPFYFSRGADDLLPQSVVLSHTMRGCMEAGLIGWENGCLRAYARLETAGAETTMTAGVSWLAMLLPSERRVLTQVTLNLHGIGIHVLSPAADVPFRHAVARALRAADGADSIERRLRMVRFGLIQG
jgi:hypothetical protein